MSRKTQRKGLIKTCKIPFKNKFLINLRICSFVNQLDGCNWILKCQYPGACSLKHTGDWAVPRLLLISLKDPYI